MDVYPRNDSVTLNFGAVPEARMTLHFMNLAPFPCEIQQGHFNLQCGGVSIEFSLPRRVKLEPSEGKCEYVSQVLSDGQVRTVKANWGSNSTSLSGTLEVFSPVNSFTKHLPSLSGVHVQPQNLRLPTTAA